MPRVCPQHITKPPRLPWKHVYSLVSSGLLQLPCAHLVASCRLKALLNITFELEENLGWTTHNAQIPCTQHLAHSTQHLASSTQPMGPIWAGGTPKGLHFAAHTHRRRLAGSQTCSIGCSVCQLPRQYGMKPGHEFGRCVLVALLLIAIHDAVAIASIVYMSTYSVRRLHHFVHRAIGKLRGSCRGHTCEFSQAQTIAFVATRHAKSTNRKSDASCSTQIVDTC